MRTASKAEAGRPALARLGLRLQTVDLAGGEALAPAVTSSPRSMTTLARGELYHSYAAMSAEPAAINKFRVRLKRRGETRAMSLSGEVTLADLLDRVRSKLATSGNLTLQFTDADGGSVLLKDEEDWQCALDVAQEAAVPPAWTGRLDIDVVDG
ncbi:hypothetical protein BMF94_6608 [Rhodotorula taiwanensis]|uniref:PB1 domain-containing protein n=1 Tax=Rhodotorula taiwanensis TaxID=741276 RepID=A0A2S5B0L8_9BASI|nr:hypothetical protein BMF94_6608 [Rhodotorula taiwanensis]